MAPHSGKVIFDILEKSLDPRYYAPVYGGPELGRKLTSLKSDGIVFTGGTQVGKLIAKAAAENLIPCLLELGGKCPVIIDKDCD